MKHRFATRHGLAAANRTRFAAASPSH